MSVLGGRYSQATAVKHFLSDTFTRSGIQGRNVGSVPKGTP